MAINKVVYGNTTLIDLTNDTVASGKMLQGTTAHGADGSAITGSIAINSSGDIVVAGPTISVSSGYYTTIQSKTINNGSMNWQGWKETEDSSGITMSLNNVTFTSGYFSTAPSIIRRFTNVIDTTIIPASAIQSVERLNGNTMIKKVTIAGDSNLVAENIKQGITIFGIEGTAKTDPALQSKSATPTETQQNIAADTGYDGLSSVTINAIDSSYVGSNVARRSSTDLSASGSVVSVPSGYYAAATSKTVAAGAAVTPATNITANPSIALDSATGIVSAVAAASKSITPAVTSGYVSSGGSGTVTVNGSNDFQLPVKAAATYIPTTTDQTIAAGQYLTGAQTIVGDSNLIAGNIKNGATIFGVSGTFGPDDIIIIGDYGLCFNNFSISSNTCISEAGTVSGNTLIAV